MHCAKIAKGFASLGVFQCTDCRLRCLIPSSVGDPDFLFPVAARESAERSMVLEMTAGADCREATGAYFADETVWHMWFTPGEAPASSRSNWFNPGKLFSTAWPVKRHLPSMISLKRRSKATDKIEDLFREIF